MNLYILRHASAGTRRSNPKLDTHRPLDKDGKRYCMQLGNALTAMKVHFDLVVSSPLKRSLQTAALVGTETGYEQRIVLSDALRPEAQYADFLQMVTECMDLENVMVVGHNPNLTHFLNLLLVNATADSARLRTASVRLRKGTIARISIERGSATLQWMLDPRITRALYASSTSSSRRKTSRK